MLRRAATLLVAASGMAARAAAQVQFDVRFDDPSGTYAPYYGDLARTVEAAGARWTSFLATPGPVNVGVRVRFDPTVSTANGASTWWTPVGASAGVTTYAWGMASELATGVVPHGPGVADVAFTVGSGYLANTLWFDPDPTARTAPIPAFHVDALSVFTHEFGHALAFNGWRDWTTAQLPGPYESTYDRWVTLDAATHTPYFTGPRAEAVYGGPVPLTYGNLMHVGNWAPRPGADLVPDLMNGVAYYYGRRYDVSALDLAIAADAGVVLTPEPAPVALVAVALLPAAAWRARGRATRWVATRRRAARR